jgi:Transglutaminase-like superfamily
VSSTRSLLKLAARTSAERRLLAEAALLLAITRLAVALLPFRRTARLLGLAPGALVSDPDAAQMREAELIGWAVRAAASRLPWRGTCLTQALTASVLLHRRGIPAALHLGVAKDVAAPEGLAAHAWVGCGNKILVGQAQQARFTTVATYG